MAFNDGPRPVPARTRKSSRTREEVYAMLFTITMYRRTFLKVKAELMQEIKFRLDFDFTDREIKDIKDAIRAWLSQNQGNLYKININYDYTVNGASTETQECKVTIRDAAQDLAFKFENGIILNLIIAKYLKHIVKMDNDQAYNNDAAKKLILEKYRIKNYLTLVSSKFTDNLTSIIFEDKKTKKTYEFKNEKGILLIRSYTIK